MARLARVVVPLNSTPHNATRKHTAFIRKLESVSKRTLMPGKSGPKGKKPKSEKGEF